MLSRTEFVSSQTKKIRVLIFFNEVWCSSSHLLGKVCCGVVVSTASASPVVSPAPAALLAASPPASVLTVIAVAVVSTPAASPPAASPASHESTFHNSCCLLSVGHFSGWHRLRGTAAKYVP